MSDEARDVIEGLKAAVERLERFGWKVDPERIAREVARVLKELEPAKLVNALEPVTKPIPPGWDPVRKNVILAQPPTDYVPPEKRQPPPRPEKALTADEVLERQGGWEPVLLKLGWRKAVVERTDRGGLYDERVVWLEPTDSPFVHRRYFDSAKDAALLCNIKNPFRSPE